MSPYSIIGKIMFLYASNAAFVFKKKRVKLGKADREDLDWWLKFGATFKRKRKIEYEEYPIPLISDSSLKGFAVYKGKEWLGGTWDGK